MGIRISCALAVAVSVLATTAFPVRPAPLQVARAARYEELVTLFRDWRAFQKPRMVDGVADYTAAAMGEQHRGLATYRKRLLAIDPSTWPIPQQVDHHIVRAEMNGLDFDHRVLRPWAANPAFYVTVFGSESDQPAREGHYAFPSLELWSYRWPLDAKAAAEIGASLRAIPGLLDQARKNLVGNGRDLWTFSPPLLRGQSADLQALAAKLTDPALAGLRAEAERARAASDAFAAWVAAEAPRKTGPSGVGRENYDWYLKHVQLLSHSWRDLVVMMERELARAHAALALEEQRNRHLPPAAPIADADTYRRRFQEAVTEYMAFLKDRDILTVRDGMDRALRQRGGTFSPPPREFFGEVDHHDPEVMRTHGYHWFDKLRMTADPHASPIRRDPLLYNIFITRTEGLATGWEEMMLHAGMFDARPRTRELVPILLAQRAARALGDLRMHGEQLPLEEAARFTSANTPRGWLSLAGNLVRGEQFLYLRQPAYGTSYVSGKIEIERLIADRRRQLGPAFTLRRFMDEFDAAGLIPIGLISYELTGEMSGDLKGQ